MSTDVLNRGNFCERDQLASGGTITNEFPSISVLFFRLQRPSWTKKTVSFLTWPLLTFVLKGLLYILLPWMSQSPSLSPNVSPSLPVSASVFQCLPNPPSLTQSRCSPYLGVFHALTQSSEGLRRYASSCFVSAVALATAIGPPPREEVGCVCVLEENVSIPGSPP